MLISTERDGYSAGASLVTLGGFKHCLAQQTLMMTEPVALKLTTWVMLLLAAQEFRQARMTGQHLLPCGPTMVG